MMSKWRWSLPKMSIIIFWFSEANFQKFSHTEMIKTIRLGGTSTSIPILTKIYRSKISVPSIIFFFKCGKMVKRIFWVGFRGFLDFSSFKEFSFTGNGGLWIFLQTSKIFTFLETLYLENRSWMTFLCKIKGKFCESTHSENILNISSFVSRPRNLIFWPT